LTRAEYDGTHRLIPYRYSDRRKPILDLIAKDDDLLRDLTELEGATNNRLQGESGKLPGVSTIELVSGFRLAHIVNASFTYPGPLGGCFNGPERGAWYAALQVATSAAEVVYHRCKELEEVDWTAEEVSPYIDYLADFRNEFHDIQNDSNFMDCLDPISYSASQALARMLLTSGSGAIIYPSVRANGATRIACFRPPSVMNVREGAQITFTFISAKLSKIEMEI
jgi:hypothetical protein